MDDAWLTALAASPWLLPVLFLLVVGDAFLVILPSETAMVVIGALWGATGHPDLWAVIPVAAAGALTGDLLCFAIGSRVGLDRWGWQRRGRVGAAIARAHRELLRRPAVAILTARYIPFARIAVNLAAGASWLTLRRYLPLAVIAGTAWAIYNVVIGALFGTVWSETPIIAIVVSIAVAITLGIAVDLITRQVARGVSARRRRPSD